MCRRFTTDYYKSPISNQRLFVSSWSTFGVVSVRVGMKQGLNIICRIDICIWCLVDNKSETIGKYIPNKAEEKLVGLYCLLSIIYYLLSIIYYLLSILFLIITYPFTVLSPSWCFFNQSGSNRRWSIASKLSKTLSLSYQSHYPPPPQRNESHPITSPVYQYIIIITLSIWI